MPYLSPRDNRSLAEFDMSEARQAAANAVAAADKTSYREAQPVDTDEPCQRAAVGILFSGPAVSVLFYGLVWWCWQALN